MFYVGYLMAYSRKTIRHTGPCLSFSIVQFSHFGQRLDVASLNGNTNTMMKFNITMAFYSFLKASVVGTVVVFRTHILKFTDKDPGSH